MNPRSLAPAIVPLALSASILVVACGGGGGSSTDGAAAAAPPTQVPSSTAESATANLPGAPDPTPPVPTPARPHPADPEPVASAATFNVDAAIQNFVIGPGATYTLSAVSGSGDRIVKKLQTYGGGDQTTTVNGTEYRSVVKSTSIVINDKPVMIPWHQNRTEPYDWLIVYFQKSPFAVREFYENMATMTRTAESFSPPSTGKVGDSGILFVMPKAFLNGSTGEEEVTEWALEPATADLAWFCLNERRRITVGTSTPVMSGVGAKECALVSASGAIAGYKADLVLSGTETLRFR